jgi:protein SCO1/2
MMRAALVTVLLLAGLGVAHADFSRAALDTIAAAPQPNAQLPLAAHFVDEHGAPRTLGAALDGKPAVLVFADYTCRTLCGPILAFAAGGLEKTGLTPGRDYHLIVVGIDPKDSLATATAFKDSRVGKDTPLSKATIMLSGKTDAVRAATQAAGYRYAYDPAHDQYAHPAAAYVVTGQGRVARVLSGIGLDGGDLRLALVDAGNGKIGGIVDQIHLLCYGFDPARGIYTASIARLLNIGAVLTVIAIAAGVGGMILLKRHGRAA